MPLSLTYLRLLIPRRPASEALHHPRCPFLITIASPPSRPIISTRRAGLPDLLFSNAFSIRPRSRGPGAFRALKVAKTPCIFTTGNKPCAGQACEICIAQDCQRACRGSGCISKTQPNLFQKTKTGGPRKGFDTDCPSFWPSAIFEPCSKPCKSTQHRLRRTVCCSLNTLSPSRHICPDSRFQGKF